MPSKATTTATLRRHTLAIILGATALRLLLAAWLPLVADEAYYWEWSRRLAFGFFDHPPVIAWLIAHGTAILGDTTLGVRFFAVICGMVAAFALSDIAERLSGAAAARFAALLLAATPFTVSFVLATPDAPLLAAIAMTLAAIIRATDPAAAPRASLLAWTAAGVAIGLAMASKFTAVLIPVGATLAIVAHPTLRHQLRRPGPYLAVMVASLVMLPVLRWNANHEWIAFRFQLDHGLGALPRGSWLMRELELLGGQAGLATPILFVLLLVATYRATARPQDERRFVLGVIATFCLGFFLYSATRRGVEANWPAIAWLPALALLAAGQSTVRTAWERRAVWLSGTLTAIALAHVAFPFLPIAPRKDPAARLRGWESLATAVGTEGTAAAAGTRFVAAARYQEAAFIAWHDSTHPDVGAVNLLSRRNQYDIWPRFQDRAQVGATLVLLVPDTSATPALVASLRPHFEGAEGGPIAAVVYRGDTLALRRPWTLSNWRGSWPADPNDPITRK
jgi:4-amino-4-deoxy-L-arabinose transferase-like glycosyltransferase